MQGNSILDLNRYTSGMIKKIGYERRKLVNTSGISVTYNLT